MELDDLEVVAVATTTPAKKKKTKAQQEADADWARSMGVREAFIRLGLEGACREYTLEEVTRTWHAINDVQQQPLFKER